MEVPQEQLKLKENFFSCFNSSSNSGLSTILRTRRKISKSSWLIFYFLSTGACVLMMLRCIFNYLEYDVSTKIRVFDERPMIFPAITLCATDPFQTAHANRYLQRIFKSHFKQDLNCYKQNFTYSNKTYNSLEANYFIKKHALKEIYSKNISLNRVKKFGFQLDKSIILLSFNQKPINVSELSWAFYNQNGNCYVFNSGFNSRRKKSTLKRALKPGYNNGLNMFLLHPVTSSRYNFKFHYGLEIFIHNQSITPLQTEGIFIKNGMMNFIGLKKTVFKRLARPYSECDDFSSASFQSSFIYLYIKSKNQSYRQIDCLDLCVKKVNR